MDLPVPKKELQGPGNYKGRQKTNPRKTKLASIQSSSGKGKNTSNNLICPRCQSEVKGYDEVYRCRKCKLKVPKTIAGKKINQRSVKTLLEKGETSVLKGFTPKQRNPFSPRLILTENAIRLDRS